MSFLEDVKQGLKNNPKRIPSKYFYDEKGDYLFQQIMNLPEYYLPKMEKKLLKTYSKQLAKKLPEGTINVLELGAGDGTKIVILLKALINDTKKLNYFSLDISESVLRSNEQFIKSKVPNLNYEAVAGDYLNSLLKYSKIEPKLLVFLGANIGNYDLKEAQKFFKFLRSNCTLNDSLLVAFDLKKNPREILAAYDDQAGITKEFNLNLLKRINLELGSNIKLESFAHFPNYNPVNGETNSYLISLEDQEFKFNDGSVFQIEKFEAIQTEVSKKYTLKEINQIAESSDFELSFKFTDSNNSYLLGLFKPV